MTATASGALMAGLVGLVTGSFLGVCADRLPLGRSVVRPGSHCPACGHRLSARENLPLLSFVWLRGRCRACRARIGWRDPILELATGLIFAWAWRAAGPGWEFVRLAVFLSLLLTLAATDWAERQLPDELTLGGWAIGLALAVWTGPGWRAALAASLGGAGVLALAGIGYQRWRGREGLGWGDIKMTGLLGAYLGPLGLLTAVFLASIAGALVGMAMAAAVFLLRLRQRRSWRRARAATAVFLARAALPFGLFLALGGAAAVIFGWRIA